MIAAYFVACLMSLAVSSATGLGVLLMATLFPVMVNARTLVWYNHIVLCMHLQLTQHGSTHNRWHLYEQHLKTVLPQHP